jgi:predicted DNA-binding transcriptional regulator AlpA
LETTGKKSGALASAAPALGDALVDFNYIATQLFMPSRGRDVGISRNGLALMIERGAFPQPIRFPARNPKTKQPKPAMRWRLSDLRKWLEARA